MSNVVLICQAAALFYNVILSSVRLLLSLPYALLCCCVATVSKPQHDDGNPGQCTFYEGVVEHVRRRPVHHAFRYPVRMAVVSLDDPPQWFRHEASDHMTAADARQMAGTTGSVRLLTHPHSAGYVQNPISVYYCHDTAGRLIACIAEVTNTPWGERVTFVFDPAGDTVPKSLHVSPLMDMQGQWTLKTAKPGARLALSVRVRHPELGAFFDATLSARRSEAPQVPNEHAGFGTLWRYGYEPHRVALWIYWEALQLLRKGVPFFGPPSPTQKAAMQQALRHGDAGSRRRWAWQPASGFPWSAD